jgi:hypothetical protein
MVILLNRANISRARKYSVAETQDYSNLCCKRLAESAAMALADEDPGPNGRSRGRDKRRGSGYDSVQNKVSR